MSDYDSRTKWSKKQIIESLDEARVYWQNAQEKSERLSVIVYAVSDELVMARAEIERLSLDVKILSEELEFERRPKRDER